MRKGIYSLSADTLGLDDSIIASLQEQEKNSHKEGETPKATPNPSKGDGKATGTSNNRSSASKPQEKKRNIKDDINYETLLSFGFDLKVIEKSLRLYPNSKNVESVVEYCLNNVGEEEETIEKEEEKVFGDSEFINEKKSFPNDDAFDMMSMAPMYDIEDRDELFEDPFAFESMSLDTENQKEVEETIEKTSQNEQKGDENRGEEEKNKENKVSSSETKVEPKRKFLKVPFELQRLFGRLRAADTSCVTTENLTKSFGWKGNEVYDQHDVHELNRILFDAIEKSLERTNASTLISDLYRGLWVNKVICHSCNS